MNDHRHGPGGHGHAHVRRSRGPAAQVSHGARHAHDHGRHDHTAGASGGMLGIAFALTALFMVVEFAGGLLARSLALVADAGHMLTDAAALALPGPRSASPRRPADAKRSFGYQRLRVLATFVNGCALLFIVAWIAFEAVQRLINPVAGQRERDPVDRRARPGREPDRVRACCVGATRTT